MTCHEAQLNLSLYLYGELDFATEEQFEEHLSQCAFCQRALAREKALHTALNARQVDVPLDLLAECRQGLRSVIAADRAVRKQASFFRPGWPRFWDISFNRWSAQVALGSFLLFVGFGCGHLVDRYGFPNLFSGDGATSAGFLTPSSRIRDVEPSGSDEVRIVIDQVNQREIIGRLQDENIRRLVLAAAKDPLDPGIRADSVDLLKNQAGMDVRDALLYSVQHDPNAAVRIKALEGLRRFSDDASTRNALKFVLQHDQSPDVRSEAIDILAPADQKVELSPDLIITLQDLVRSEQQGDDYTRARAMQLLRAVNSPSDVF
jgi:hypothetical protein